MAKTSKYVSKVPDENGYLQYTEEENAVWRDLVKRQEQLLPALMCQPYLEGLEALNLPKDKVPQLKDVNDKLMSLTGFGVEPVSALITPHRFFELLAERKFPAASFIRTRDEFDYLQEPDIFHEIYGHCPLLTNKVYCDFMQKYGELALSLDKKYIWLMQRLFWFTVEFGLMDDGEHGTKIYGAGIASSAGESPYALDSDIPERRLFDALTVLRTPYRIDIFQTVYYVISSFEELYELVTHDFVPLLDQALELGDLPKTFPNKS